MLVCKNAPVSRPRLKYIWRHKSHREVFVFEAGGICGQSQPSGLRFSTPSEQPTSSGHESFPAYVECCLLPCREDRGMIMDKQFEFLSEPPHPSLTAMDGASPQFI